MHHFPNWSFFRLGFFRTTIFCPGRHWHRGLTPGSRCSAWWGWLGWRFPKVGDPPNHRVSILCFNTKSWSNDLDEKKGVPPWLRKAPYVKSWGQELGLTRPTNEVLHTWANRIAIWKTQTTRSLKAWRNPKLPVVVVFVISANWWFGSHSSSL